MKVIHCYIENFGKFKKFSYEFKAGLNIIEQENGWGKTTLAAFIKAMFYGLDYKRGKAITDRKRYRPWNRGKFGGYIVFEQEGTQYKVERFFGKKDIEDTCTVYNLSTNTVTEAFGPKLGEQLWQIDRDSYEKTAFISLEDSSLLNDIISSKLGNIEDGERDLETSSKAEALLEKEMINIKGKRGTSGLIKEKKESIATLKQELKQCNNSKKSMGTTEERILEEQEKLRQKNNQISQIEKEQSQILLYEKKQQYESLKEECKVKREELEDNKKFFKGNIPSKENLELLNNRAVNYTNQQGQLEQKALSQVEQEQLEELLKEFKQGKPSLDEMGQCNQNIMKWSNCRTTLGSCEWSEEEAKEIHRLEEKYKEVKEDSSRLDDYINAFNQVTVLDGEAKSIKLEIEKLKRRQEENQERRQRAKQDQQERQRQLEAHRQQMKNGQKKANGLLMVGIAVFIIGIIMVLQSLMAGGGVAAIGLVIVVIALMKRARSKDGITQENVESYHESYQEVKQEEEQEEQEKLESNLQDISARREGLVEGYQLFFKRIHENPDDVLATLLKCKEEIGQYGHLNTQIQLMVDKRTEIQKEIEQVVEAIEEFFAPFDSPLENQDYEKALSTLREQLTCYEKLSKKEEEYGQLKARRDELFQQLSKQLLLYYEEMPEEVSEGAREVNTKYYELENIKKQWEQLKDKLDRFKEENQDLKLEEVVLPDRELTQLAKDLSKEKEDLEIEKTDNVKRLERMNKDLEGLSTPVDRIEDIESAITQLEIESDELEEQHQLLEATKKCMIEAKNNLAAKYVGNMSESFKKYMRALCGDNSEQYQVDIKLDVKVEQEGELHDSNQLSKGMKDLVQVCMRMALVDAVYEAVENPLLVLDDPFVNLDNSKIERATRLLVEIGQNYQVVYFICHSSRNLPEVVTK